MAGMQGMSSMPGMKGGAETKAPQTSEFVVPVERQQQIGVTYATVERKPLQHSIHAVGMVEPDLQRRWAFVARVEGYVQQLFVTSPGQIVEKNAPLMSIYSPELVTTQRELVMLLHMRDAAKMKDVRETPERLIDAAKVRLEQCSANKPAGNRLFLVRPIRKRRANRGPRWEWVEDRLVAKNVPTGSD